MAYTFVMCALHVAPQPRSKIADENAKIALKWYFHISRVNFFHVFLKLIFSFVFVFTYCAFIRLFRYMTHFVRLEFYYCCK